MMNSPIDKPESKPSVQSGSTEPVNEIPDWLTAQRAQDRLDALYARAMQERLNVQFAGEVKKHLESLLMQGYTVEDESIKSILLKDSAGYCWELERATAKLVLMENY